MRFKKALACIISASMLCASLTGCGSPDNTKADTAIKDKATNATSDAGPGTQAETTGKGDITTVSRDVDLTGSGSDEQSLKTVVGHFSNSDPSNAAKQETVYVKTGPSGTVNSIVVSNWLKNTGNSEELIDSSDLKDITNVKGDETYHRDKDGNVIWEANGDDIYYQGTTDRQLPVDVSISYKLNGRPVSAEDLAGKSGHVEIDISYRNNCENTVMIDDREEHVYTPFAVVSGVMLDEEKFHDIKVSNGTVIADGKRDIVVGMAFPGLIDSLNGTPIEDSELAGDIADRINIPSEVKIEAEAEDFESGMILTMVNSDIVDSLGLDDIDSVNMSGIQDSIREFSDAGEQLSDGTGRLQSGAQTLANGGRELAGGADALHTGILAYTNGVGRIADGATRLDEGAARLDSGAGDLKSGISELDNGMDSLNKGIRKTSDGASALKDGTENVNAGALQLKSGAEAVSAGVNTLTGQVTAIAGGVGQAAGAAGTLSAGIDALANATSVATTPDEIDTSSIALSGLVDGNTASALMLASLPTDQLETMGLTPEQIEGVKAIVAATSSGVIPAIVDNAATEAARAAAAQAGANGANAAKQQINAAITTPGEAGVSLQQGAAMLSSSLNESYNSLTSENSTSQLAALQSGAAELAAGAGSLAEGTSALRDGAQALYDGTVSLGEGSNKLKDGTGALNTGIASLKEGTASLKNGTGSLSEGVSELNSNSGGLTDGSLALSKGSTSLTDGLEQLLEGTTELNEGMIRFNNEGIRKLSTVFGSDIDSISSRIMAISEAGRNYKSFGGTSQDEDCSVRFIIESEEIKK
ncbi:MAG: hypothetical protein K5662_04755 [Lachnospiraceae bacterium]|nr:hypothetical protein [Lachnospiraceae bacterium]